MRRTRLARGVVALATCAGAACTTSPAPIAPAAAVLPVVVPIEVYRHRVYLPARIAGSDTARLILDNGASVSGVRDSVARALGVRQSKTAKLTGNGQSIISIGLATNVPFDVGGVTIREPLAAILPYDEFARHEGRLNAGVLGKDVYARFVVDIDYAAHRLTLRDPATFTYDGSGIVIPLHVSRNADFAWMSARVTFPGLTPIEARLGLDMGTYTALRFYSPFVKQHRLASALPNGVASYGFGLGGEFPVRLARASHLAIAALDVDRPVAELSLAGSGATAGSSVDGTIGGAILSCYRVIVDYAHDRMILEPNGQACSSPSDADMSGLVLDAGGPRLATITVGHVIAATPGADAGFREGDRLVAIDGTPADSLGLLRVETMFTHAAAYRVTIQRAGGTSDLTLRTRPLI